MSRQRIANGSTPIAASFPSGLVTAPTFWTAAGTSTKTVQDETITINATGLMELDFRPVEPSSVEIYTAVGKGGSQFSVRTDRTPTQSMEVLIEPNGYLTFHSDEYSSSAYAWYSGLETIITASILQMIFEELRALGMHGGKEIHKANEALTKGDCVTPVGHDGTFGWWAKAVPPLGAHGVCNSAASLGREISIIQAGMITGLAENFGSSRPALFVSTAARLTTNALGSAPTIKQYVGTGIANGKAIVNFQAGPQMT